MRKKANAFFRFYKYVEFPQSSEGCWQWMGTKDQDGYGLFWLNGSRKRAHRVSYEWMKGLIPEELELDHLCKNPSCVNPNHLESVSHQENCKRGEGGKKTGEKNKQKMNCPKGHPYNKENTYVRFSSKRNSCRICRTCSKERMRQKRGWRGGKPNRDKTHCPLGHPLSGDNLHIRPRGGRTCMACHRIAQKRYKAKKRKQ